MTATPAPCLFARLYRLFDRASLTEEGRSLQRLAAGMACDERSPNLDHDRPVACEAEAACGMNHRAKQRS